MQTPRKGRPLAMYSRIGCTRPPSLQVAHRVGRGADAGQDDGACVVEGRALRTLTTGS